MYLDITGAFDNIKWLPMVIDLEGLGASAESVKNVSLYLEVRTVTLEVEGCREVKALQKGCPQGSRLGPFLWTVTMDRVLRIPWENHTSYIAYADDLVILVGVAHVETAVASQGLNSATSRIGLSRED